MKIFRINLYLKFVDYFLSFFNSPPNIENQIEKIIKNNSKKKYFLLSSQLRVSFLILLKYLKNKNPQKKEIIFSAYNLEEMIEIAKNLNLKIVLSDIDYSNGSLCKKELIKKINKNTLAVIYTNMFNNYKDQFQVKRYCLNKKVTFIEDNAIYFDNYTQIKNKKIFSGSLGDYTLYSFNIMKNISGLYGGGISFNNQDFYNFNKKFQSNFTNFPTLLYLKQNFIYLILKLFSLKTFYNFIFFHIVRYAHFKNKNFLLNLFYPSLRFRKKRKFPQYYFSGINSFSKKIILRQLKNFKQRESNHKIRKENNKYYFASLKKMKLKQIQLLKIDDFNYQNFLDFPVLVENKKLLNNFLLLKGFEVKYIHYKNCSKTFNINFNTNKNSNIYHKNIICLPSHSNIDKKYINNILFNIKKFYKNYDPSKKN